MFIKKIFSTSLFLFILFGVIGSISFSRIEVVFAAALSSLSDTQSSIKVSAVSDHTIQFVTPTGLTAGQNISITFPAGWNLGGLGATSTDFATSTSASCSGFGNALLRNGAASGLTWGVATTTQSITITSGTAVIPANRCIQISFGSNAIFQASGTSQITNPSTATSSVILIGGSFADTGSITTNIITDDTVSVSATVAQSFSFTISTSTIFFGALGSGAAKFASSTNSNGDSIETVAHSLLVSTNAPAGYTITIKGQTLTSLQNASNTIDAIGVSVASSTPGSEQFGIRASASGGSGYTIDPTFAAASSYGYDATATTSATFATGSGATNTTTYALRYVANIAPLTEAGTYVANVVYVATANF